MSRETRIEKRKIKRRRYLVIVGIAAVLILIFAVISRINKQQKVLTLSTWETSEKAKLYFFKEIDAVTIDQFGPESLSVEAGTKVNGYTPLTKTDMVIHQDWIARKCQMIQYLLTAKAPDSWSAEVSRTLQITSGQNVPSGAGYSIADIAPFVGLSESALTERLEILTALGDGQPRPITLQSLGGLTNGYVYTSVSPRRKALNAKLVPYLSLSLLDALNRLSTSNETALNVIGNDQLFVAAVLDNDIVIAGEDQTNLLKQSNIEENGIAETGYIDLLTNRMDLVQQYPVKTISVGEASADVYLVDVVYEGGSKILIMMLKNYLTGFVTRDVVKGEIITNRVYGYEIPASAVKTDAAGESILTVMRKGYFPKEVSVTLSAEEGRKVILSASDNPELREGESYKVHP